MEFELWWLLALPLAFGLGWLASRLDLRQWRREGSVRRDAALSYFRGLNFLLSEQQDQAIDAFIEAVTADPNTVDLHFALGNLFRRRGEYERAVRVHQNLLERADLPAPDRQRAQIALAQDFLKAGLLDRAEAAYDVLRATSYRSEALAALLQIHERTREWERAIDTAHELERIGAGSYARQLAHYWCELALRARQRGDLDAALHALDQAVAVDPRAVRPWQLRAALAQQQGHEPEAIAHLRQIAQLRPEFLALVAVDMARLFQAAGQQASGRDWLLAQLQDNPAIDLLDAVLLLEPDAATRRHHALTFSGRSQSGCSRKRLDAPYTAALDAYSSRVPCARQASSRVRLAA